MNAGLYQYLFKFQFRKTRHDVHVLLWLRHQNTLEVFGLNCSICLQAAFNEIAMKWCSFRCHQGINRKILEARTIHDGVQNSSSYISPLFHFYGEKFVNKMNGILNMPLQCPWLNPLPPHFIYKVGHNHYQNLF